MNPNPFYISGAVSSDKFVGRKSEVNKAFDTIANRTARAIQGSSGMGKSSLLQYITLPTTWFSRGLQPSQAYILFLNCYEIQPFTPISFWENILTDLIKKVDSTALQSMINQIIGQGTYDINELRTLLAEIGKENKFLLLLLDDFDAALYANSAYTEDNMRSFLSNFRNLVTHGNEQVYISVIVTALKNLTELGPEITPGTSPWNNHYSQGYLKPFNEKEISQWFEQMSEQYSIPWLLDLKATIQKISGAHPALIQNAGFQLYSLSRDGETQTPEEFARDFENATRQYFVGAWKHSDDDEKTLLKFIALSHLEGRLNRKHQYTLDGVDIILSQKATKLRNLESRGLLCRRVDENEQEAYEFASSIMEWWVIQHLENSKNQPEITDREIIFLNLSRKQIKQITNIMEQVWQRKDTIKAVPAWLGGLAGAFARGFAGSGTPS
ncbi:MAG: NACHT domain-containing protein [Cyanobacteria bacterium J06621_15]